MAAKKKARKGKRKATPAQMAALKKAHAVRKANLKAGKSGKKRKPLRLKKGPKRMKVYRATPRTLGPGEYRGMNGQVISAGVGQRMGAQLAAAFNAGKKSVVKRKTRKVRKSGSGKRRKSTGMTVTAPRARKGSKKGGNVVTAASILKGARAGAMKLYLCGGKKRTGCGGGSRVVGILR